MLPSDFFTNLPANSLILTPNRRLSSFIENQYSHCQLKQNQMVWAGLNVHPFSQWLISLWQNCLQINAKLLTEQQAQYVWEQIIQENSPDLLKIDAAAKQAIEASRLLTLWQIPLDPLLFASQPDCQQFMQWYQAYLNYCEEKNFLDANLLAKTIHNHFENFYSQLNQIAHIFLIGFDELPPLWSELITKCARFCKITYLDFKTTANKKIRYEFNDFKEELFNAAAWLKKEYQQNPKQRLACVIPNLSEQRVLIEKTFFKIFSPQKFMQLNDQSDLPYNTSAGQSLNSFDIISTANEIINFEFESELISIGTIKMLLRSPFIIGYYKEFGKRANLEFKLAGFNFNCFSLKFFVQLLMQYCPILYTHFYKLLETIPPKKNSLEHWLNYFNHCLEILGWPGERELSSQNFQLIQRYKESWNEVLTLNSFIENCSRRKVSQLLKEICEKTLFQIRTGDKPIQILGTLEAAGICFDKLWLMQTNDNIWPASANPNPFIPHHIQKKYQLPHSSAEREWQFAKTLFTRFTHSASEFYVSSIKQQDQQEVACSFLIKDWPISACDLEIHDPVKMLINSKQLEDFQDEQSLAITPEELKNIKGGAAILKAQAACPFKAFAKFRLNASQSPLPQPGLTALERGKIVHSGLEFFWQRLQSLENLKKLAANELGIVLQECISAAILSIHPRLYQTSAKLFQIESKRLIRIFKVWLELELKRDNFCIYKTEEPIQTEFLNLPLTLRIDRIDQLDSGALVLIDYKTGETSPNDWLNERMDEPQLPLYALIYPETIDGIVFGQVKSNDFAIKGFSNNLLPPFQDQKTKDINVNNKMNWNELKQNWQHHLATTTKAFLDGCANVDPKDGKQTCQYCELASFCRIEELTDATR